MASVAILIRLRYLPDSIVAQLVSVSAFLHSLDPKQSFAKTGPPQSRLRTILALCTCRAREAGHRNKGRSALGPKTRHELTFKLDQSDRADQWRIAESLAAAAHAESLGDKPKPSALATPPRGVDPDVDHQEAA